jgi:hypothetical protein
MNSDPVKTNVSPDPFVKIGFMESLASERMPKKSLRQQKLKNQNQNMIRNIIALLEAQS